MEKYSTTVLPNRHIFHTPFFAIDFIYKSGIRGKLLAVNAEASADMILSSNTVYSNPVNYWQRFEYKNIDELMDIKKPTGCVVLATVIRIQTEHPWFYHKCTKCNNMVERLYQLVDENSEDEEHALEDLVRRPVKKLVFQI